jgi:hypothetical protein
MKKKIIYSLIALLSLSFVLTSCKKGNDVVAISKELPAISLSSIGLTQNGPFPTTSTIQVVFGATTTSTTTGAFDLTILNGSTVVKTVHFTSWTGQDATKTHSISYTTQPTAYPNTTVYTGTILLKLSVLGLTSGTTYGVKGTAYNVDGSQTSTFTQASLINVQ